MRILYTCHEGCDPRIWQWCAPGITQFAAAYDATLIQLPKSKLRNPQWVLFDAMRHSLSYPDDAEFAWIDSDIVVNHCPTDIWLDYAQSLTLCLNAAPNHAEFFKYFALPPALDNICTGIVKWNRSEAQQIVAWVDKNIKKMPSFKQNVGDQEVLILAMHDLRLGFRYFHRSMHVAGANPPIKTAFKHKGGKRDKLIHIPRFLEMNAQYRIDEIRNNPPRTSP